MFQKVAILMLGRSCTRLQLVCDPVPLSWSYTALYVTSFNFLPKLEVCYSLTAVAKFSLEVLSTHHSSETFRQKSIAQSTSYFCGSHGMVDVPQHRCGSYKILDDGRRACSKGALILRQS